MKRLVTALALSALVLGAWGQGLLLGFDGASSLESQITGGLSLNEIDSSFTFQSDFGSVGNPFIFGGVVGNPGLLTNSGSTTIYRLGYFQSGSLPYSGFGAFSVGNRTNAIPGKSSSVPSGVNTVNVVSGATTTTYTWYTNSTDSTYSLPSALNSYYAYGQGFLKVAGITTGLVVESNPSWSATDTAAASGYYLDQVRRRYYNSAGAGVAPTTVLNDTLETVTKNINTAGLPGAGGNGVYSTSSNLYFGIPFAMKTGDLEHTAELSLDFIGTDRSGDYSVTQSAYASTTYGIPANITDETLTLESKTSQVQIGAAYRLALPPLLKALGGKFYAGLSVLDAISGQTYTFDDITKPYTTGGTANTKTAAAGGTHVSRVDTYAASNYINIVAMAAHGIELAPLEDTAIALLPTFSISYANDGNNAFATPAGVLTERVAYTETLNSSFVNDGTTAYTKTTTSYTGSSAKRDTFKVDLQLPSSFKTKPSGWPIGFLAGATGSLDFSWRTDTTGAQTTTTKTENLTGSTVNSTTTSTTSATPTMSSVFTGTFSEAHSFGIFMPFQGGMRADLRLNGSNLLILDNLTLQLYVPLK